MPQNSRALQSPQCQWLSIVFRCNFFARIVSTPHRGVHADTWDREHGVKRKLQSILL